MAKDQTKRLNPVVIQEDKNVVAALATLAPVYAPSNAAYSLVNLNTSQGTMITAQGVEVQKEGEAAAARDGANTKEWAFHNLVLEAKKQVFAQYGSDSDQVQASVSKRSRNTASPPRRSRRREFNAVGRRGAGFRSYSSS